MPSNEYWYYGVCISLRSMDDAFEDWPTYFATPPRVGDYITAKTGRRLQVVSLNHKFAEGNKSIMYIELSRESANNITPTEGGTPEVGIASAE